MPRPVNQAQRAVLDWLATGARDTPPIAAYKQVSVALQTRGLVTISRAGGIWSATLTSAGRYFQKHGRYRTSPSSTSQGERGPEFEVDSPRGIRAPRAGRTIDQDATSSRSRVVVADQVMIWASISSWESNRLGS